MGKFCIHNKVTAPNYLSYFKVFLEVFSFQLFHLIQLKISNYVFFLSQKIKYTFKFIFVLIKYSLQYFCKLIICIYLVLVFLSYIIFRTTKCCNLSLGFSDHLAHHDPDSEISLNLSLGVNDHRDSDGAISMGVLGLMHLLKPNFCDLCYKQDFSKEFVKK